MIWWNQKSYYEMMIDFILPCTQYSIWFDTVIQRHINTHCIALQNLIDWIQFIQHGQCVPLTISSSLFKQSHYEPIWVRNSIFFPGSSIYRLPKYSRSLLKEAHLHWLSSVGKENQSRLSGAVNSKCQTMQIGILWGHCTEQSIMAFRQELIFISNSNRLNDYLLVLMWGQ